MMVVHGRRRVCCFWRQLLKDKEILLWVCNIIMTASRQRKIVLTMIMEMVMKDILMSMSMKQLEKRLWKRQRYVFVHNM